MSQVACPQLIQFLCIVVPTITDAIRGPSLHPAEIKELYAACIQTDLRTRSQNEKTTSFSFILDSAINLILCISQ